MSDGVEPDGGRTLEEVQREIAVAGDRLMLVRRELALEWLGFDERERLVGEARELDAARERLFAEKRRLLAGPLATVVATTARMGPRLTVALEVIQAESDRAAIEMLMTQYPQPRAAVERRESPAIVREVGQGGSRGFRAPQRDWKRMLGAR